MRRLWLTLAVALVALATSIARPSADADAMPIPTGWSWVSTTRLVVGRVGVVGDSLVYEAEHGPGPDPYYQRHQLTDALNRQRFAARVAEASARDTSALRLWGGWRSPPTAIVMALGSNDRLLVSSSPLTTRVPIATSKANVTAYLNRFPAACPVLVGVVEHWTRWRHDLTAPEWNAWLRGEAARRGGVYLDWQAVSAPHPEWFQADGLHHTEAGRAGYRQAIVAGVKACP